MSKLDKYSKSMVTTGDRVQSCTVTYHQNNTEQVSSFNYLGIEVSQDDTVSLTEKASFTQDLQDQFPYITKYMDRNVCIIGSLPTLRGPISSVTKTFGLHPQ